ncbi:MAG: class I SAM-dependent rRNA methyltransferase [Cytophagaceae bacterium]
MNLPIIKLKKGRDRSILKRHPWIFSGGIEGKVPAEDGDIVEIQDVSNNFLAYGFYSTTSQISCRLFEFDKEKNAFQTVDYWKEKIHNALLLRKSLIDTTRTNAYRLLHAEGDFFPGLIADAYNDVLVLQVLIKAVEKLLPLLKDALTELGFKNIYVRAKSSSTKLEDINPLSGWLSGEANNPVTVMENGLLFNVDFIEGQKTGFFIDQRDNRLFLQAYAQDKTVLNAFSYSGGFSVYALAGMAKEVHSLDISAAATNLAEENVALNGLPKEKHKSITDDCFDFLKDMPDDFYDLIVLDPPAFAKNARAVENASRGYKQINMKAIKKIKPGGILFTYSCSQNINNDLFRKILFGAAADVRRNVRIIQQLHQPLDHPINIYHPEGEYLKGLVLWVE